MKKLLTAVSLAGAMAATPALAQADAAAAAPATEAPAAAPAAEAPAPITDAELDMFAVAATKVNDIAQDTALSAEEKQTAMVAAVSGSGLDPHRFNEIATKSQSDEALKTRLAEAFARRPAPATAEAQPAAAESEEAEQAGG